MIKIDQIFNPLVKLFTVGATAKKRKRKLKYKVISSGQSVISTHYTKRAAIKASKKVKGRSTAVPIGQKRTSKRRRVYSGYGNVNTSTRSKNKRYVYKSGGTF